MLPQVGWLLLLIEGADEVGDSPGIDVVKATLQARLWYSVLFIAHLDPAKRAHREI